MYECETQLPSFRERVESDARLAAQEILNKVENAPFAGIKISLVGPFGSGKTSLLSRWSGDGFNDQQQPTLGANFSCVRGYHALDTDKGRIPVRFAELFWDTAGQERFATLMPLYARDASVIILVVDAVEFEYPCNNGLATTVKASSQGEFLVMSWLSRISEIAFADPPAVLVCVNKVDLSKNRDRPHTWVNEFNQGSERDPKWNFVRIWREARAFETSAKTGENVAAVHEAIQRVCAFVAIKSAIPLYRPPRVVEPNTDTDKGGCC